MARTAEDRLDSSASRSPLYSATAANIEAAVREGRKPWDTLRDAFRTVRTQDWAGLTFLNIALHEEWRWRSRLADFGIDGSDVFQPRSVEGTRQAQTDKDHVEADLAWQRLRMWQPAARVGWAIAVCEWNLARIVAAHHRWPDPDVRRFRLWLATTEKPGAAIFGGMSRILTEADSRIFDRISHVLVEATAALQGYIMESSEEHDSEAAARANFFLAGLVRSRISLKGPAGGRLRRALSPPGEASTVELTPWQEGLCLNELPGATRIGWAERENRESIQALVNRVCEFIAYMAHDEELRAKQRKTGTDIPESWLEIPYRGAKHHLEGETDPVRFAEEERPQRLLLEEEREKVWEVLNAKKRAPLSPQERKMLDLRAKGRSYKQIAAACECKPGQVGVVLERARNKVAAEMIAAGIANRSVSKRAAKG